MTPANSFAALPGVAPTAATPAAATIARKLRRYRQASPLRSSLELAVTLAGYGLFMFALFSAVSARQFVLYALLILPAAGFLVRLFMIQHDCAHRSFFRGRAANDWLGRLIGVATLTPHDQWRTSHAFHHASSGDLDRRGVGDVFTLTVAEYRARSRWARLRYRLYRHPLVMFGVGPAYLFVLHNRLPMGFLRAGWRPWLSTMATNAGIAAIVVASIAMEGFLTFLSVFLPVVLIAAATGVWLFYVQHQFEGTQWTRGKSWNAHDAALHGSSYYALPKLLQWFTANIGMHNVHHLSSQIPFYRLPEAVRDHEQFATLGRVTLRQSVRAVRLALWDEERSRLVSIADAISGDGVADSSVDARRSIGVTATPRG